MVTIWIALLALCSLPVEGWQFCFMCAGMGPRSECESNPMEFSFGPSYTNCTAPYCTTVNVFLRETADHPFVQTHSIARLCDRQDKGNWCIFDDKFITCYSTCSKDFCNDDIPNPYLLPQRSIDALGVVSGYPPQRVIDRANGVVPLPHRPLPTHAPSRENSVERGNHVNVKDEALNDVSRMRGTLSKENSVEINEVDYSQESKESHIVEQQIVDQPRAEKWFLKASDRNGGSRLEYFIAVVMAFGFFTLL